MYSLENAIKKDLTGFTVEEIDLINFPDERLNLAIEEVQLEAVRENKSSIRFITNPSEAVIEMSKRKTNVSPKIG